LIPQKWMSNLGSGMPPSRADALEGNTTAKKR
jgi:hypothetical protein